MADSNAPFLASRLAGMQAPAAGDSPTWNPALGAWVPGPGGAAAMAVALAAQAAANAAQATANTAQATANTALANAAAAQASANAAQATANTALANAATAQTSANTAQATANTALAATEPPVADLATLAALNVTGMPLGTQRYVVSTAGVYVLTAGIYTPDGLEVIAAAAPSTYYWIASLVGRWDDLLGDVSQGTGAAALTYEGFRDTPNLMYFFRSGQDDSLSMRFQFPHGVLPTGVVIPHLHVIPMSAPGAPQNVRILGRYAWAIPGTAVPANAGWTTFGPLSIPYTAADQYQPKMINLATIPVPVGFGGSSILLVYCQRNGLNPADTYTTAKPAPGTPSANLALSSLDVHYRKATQGSITDIP